MTGVVLEYCAADILDEPGKVNCGGLKANSEKLDEFLSLMDALNLDDFERWDDERKMTFWINAYNAAVLKVIIQNYPI